MKNKKYQCETYRLYSAPYENNRCLVCDSYKTKKYLCGHDIEFLMSNQQVHRTNTRL